MTTTASEALGRYSRAAHDIASPRSAPQEQYPSRTQEKDIAQREG